MVTWPDQSLVGKTVFVMGERRTISRVYTDTEGGIIINEPVDGLRSWNLDSPLVKLEAGQ